MTHNLQPFKPITYNLSSEKPGFKKFAFQVHNLQRYAAAVGSNNSAVLGHPVMMVGRPGGDAVGAAHVESS
jgi:hypothetical protein